MRLNSATRFGLSIALCVNSAATSVPDLFAQAQRRPAVKTLDKDARAELLLSRMTFGATPMEIAAVRSAGTDAWFERQLQPQSIDDSKLEQHLDAYPALRMSQEQRLQRYPEPATIRQLAKTGALPSDPEARAIVGDQVEFYQMVQQNKAAKGGAAGPSLAMTGTAQGPAATLEQSTQPMARAEVDAILAMSPTDRYGRLLSMPPAELIALRKAARGPMEGRLSEGMSPLQKETLLALSGTNRMMNAETQGSRLLRDIYSERQVEAVMTDFWLNHFNVFSGKNGQEPSLIPEYEKTVRAHALGRFDDLLIATAQSPAMLMYLDNATSVGPDSVAASRIKRFPRAKQNLGLNENYARELMELHTLGVGGGYTQQDVTEVARVFTGWTIERPFDGGSYVFTPNRHQPGSKTVLGQEIQPGDEKEGLQVLHMLATSPATARFISTELAQRFVSDAPAAALVDRMSRTFLSSGGDIKAVLRSMVHAPEFYQPANVNAKLKTPLEYVASAVRVSSADITNPLPLVQALQQLGMPLYGCQPPTGYKWDQDTWLSSAALVNRMNFALALSTNRIGGVTTDWASTPGTATVQTAAMTRTDAGPDPEAIRKEAMLESRLFSTPVSDQTRQAVITQGNDSTAQQAAGQFAAGSGPRVLTDAEKQAQQQDRLDAMMAGRVKGAGGGKGQAGPQRGLGAAPARMGPVPADRQAAAMAGLLIGSPEFQRR